jgi:hypothetical protein
MRRIVLCQWSSNCQEYGSVSRCRAVEVEDQPITCVTLEGGPCSACKQRATIRCQIKQLEDEIAQLKDKSDNLATTMNAIHDPLIHKLLKVD